jgi:hypothetical protein
VLGMAHSMLLAGSLDLRLFHFEVHRWRPAVCELLSRFIGVGLGHVICGFPVLAYVGLGPTESHVRCR